MFSVGDKVLAISNRLLPEIAEMLDGKIGTITDRKDMLREVVVYFPNTGRSNGLFAMDTSQIEFAKTTNEER